MAAAQDLIAGALRLIGAIATGETPSAAELQDGRGTLNGIVQSWNITPGLAPKSGAPLPVAATLTQVLALPDGYEIALRHELGIAMAPEFGIEPSATVQRNAMKFKAVVKRSNQLDPPELTVEPLRLSGATLGDLGAFLAGDP